MILGCFGMGLVGVDYVGCFFGNYDGGCIGVVVD